MKKERIYLLTEQELERFDHMLTALGQAYWALMHKRFIAIKVPDGNASGEITQKEKEYYQMHMEFNEQIENDDSF